VTTAAGVQEWTPSTAKGKANGKGPLAPRLTRPAQQQVGTTAGLFLVATPALAHVKSADGAAGDAPRRRRTRTRTRRRMRRKGRRRPRRWAKR
jgi:hypothetical protein